MKNRPCRPNWMNGRIFGQAALLPALFVAQGASFGEIADRISECSPTGCVIELEPGGQYIETNPWDLRGKQHVSVRGQGSKVIFNFPPERTPPVVIDASGAYAVHFEGWTMGIASKGGRPDVGLLLARNEKNESSGEHHFARWRIMGWYRKAAIAAIASEVNVWLHCFLSNSYPNSIVYWTGRDNELGIESQFGAFGSGSTNTCHDFLATGFGNYGMVYGDNEEGISIVVGDGTHDLHLRGGTMSMRGREGTGSVGGKCAIQLGSRGRRPVHNVLLDAVEWETVGARNGVVVRGVAKEISIRDSLLQSTEASIRIERSGKLLGAIVEGNRLIAGLATYDKRQDKALVHVMGAMERSLVDVSYWSPHSERLSKSLYVAEGASVRHNEFRIRDKADIMNIKTSGGSNRVNELPRSD